MKNLERIFRFASFVFALSAAYHCIGIFHKINASSHLRHAVFFGINIIFFIGFIKRPAYFVFAFAVLLVQQLLSHGSSLLRNWEELGLINWVDFLVVILLPIFFIALILEKANKKRHLE